MARSRPPLLVAPLVLLLVAAGLAGSARANAPVLVSAPSISGTPMEGEVLEAHPGTYTGALPPFTFKYEWQRCNNGGGDCRSFGPTGTLYTATAADIGYRLRTLVAVTGLDCTDKKSDGTHDCAFITAQVGSEQTRVVVANPALRPQSTAAPTISGTPEERATLTAEDGGWTGPAPIITARQWERCDTGGNACTAIPGATAPAYEVTREDVQHRLRVVVTASNSRGTAGPVASAVTEVVRIFLPRPGRTTIGAALVETPEQLVIDRVVFTPARLRAPGRFTVRVRVSDTRGFRIRGAVVRIAGITPSSVGVVRDVRTGSDGWAHVALRPSARVVFRRGAVLRLLVRAFRVDEGPEGDVAAEKTAGLPLR